MAAVTSSLGAVRARAGETARLVMLQHTVFALPFAVLSMVTATPDGWPAPRIWGWVAVAMVGARTAAMAFNRLVDERIDAANPRTADRPLPAGTLSRAWAWGVVAVASAAFVVAAGMLNPTCLLLAPPTLTVLLGYSYAKRFTWLSHLWLGSALGFAPVGAWLAVTGSVSWTPVVLGAAVACWVAGFDVVYSLQDEAFDRAHGLWSVPSRFGVGPALVIARGLHVLALLGFGLFAALAGGGAIRFAAVALAAALLVWQHRLVRRGRLDRVDAAFFTANGTLSLLMGVAFLFAKMRGIG